MKVYAMFVHFNCIQRLHLDEIRWVVRKLSSYYLYVLPTTTKRIKSRSSFWTQILKRVSFLFHIEIGRNLLGKRQTPNEHKE